MPSSNGSLARKPSSVTALSGDATNVERTGRSKVTGTVGGYVRTVRDMAAVLR